MFPTSAYICFAIFASLASAWLFFLSFCSLFGLFCLLWRLLGRFLGQNMPKSLDPGCPRVLLSYGFPRNSLVCLGSADVSKKCSQMSKMSPQSVQDDPQSSPKSAKEGPNEAQRHPMSATRVPKDAKFPTSAYICFAIFASLASAWLFFLSFSSPSASCGASWVDFWAKICQNLSIQAAPECS